MKQAQIITIAEIKGGTGKTTTAAALAQAAFLNGKKVLIIDLDGQGTISHRFSADTTAPGTYNLFADNTPIVDTIQATEQGPDVISGAPDLYTIKGEKGSITTLAEKLEPIKKAYDLIIIDTPPALNVLTFNAMQASTGLLIACYADEGSADGLILTLDYAKAIKKTNAKLKVLGCIITQYDSRPIVCRQFRELVIEAAEANRCPYICDIRRGISVQEAAAYGKNLFKYAPKSKPAQDYMTLYKAIIK